MELAMTSDWGNCLNNVEESAKVAGKVGAVAGGAVGAYATVKLAPAVMLSRALAIGSGIYLGTFYGLSDSPSGTIDIAPVDLGKLASPSRVDIANGLLGITSGGVAGYLLPKATNVASIVIGGAQLGSLGASMAVRKAGMLYCDSRYEKPVSKSMDDISKGISIELPKGGMMILPNGQLKPFCEAVENKTDASCTEVQPATATPTTSTSARAASAAQAK